MAILVRPNGNRREVFPSDREQGFSLAELYELLNCDYVQAIGLPDGRTMWMDEEAKLHAKRPPVNPVATELLMLAGGLPGDVVLGNVLLCGPGEVK